MPKNNHKGILHRTIRLAATAAAALILVFAVYAKPAAAASTITVGAGPNVSILSGSNLYVANTSAGTVSVVNTNTNTVTSTITVGTAPEFPILVGSNLYIFNYGSASVSVIDTNPSDGTYNTVTATIATGTEPIAPVLSGTSLYVSDRNSNTVSVINTTNNTLQATITVGADPQAGNLIGTNLYVPCSGAASVSVIDTNPSDGTYNTVTATIAVGTIPNNAKTPDVVVGGRYLYVLNSTAHSVSVIDTNSNTVTTTINVGTAPNYETLVGTNLYVCNYSSSGSVSVIDVNPSDGAYNTVTTTLTGIPYPVTPVASGTTVYIPSITGGTVTAVNNSTTTVISTITVGAYPDYDTNSYLPYPLPIINGNLYVPNYNSATVSVINTSSNTVIETIPVGTEVAWPIQVGTSLYLSNESAGTLSVINTVAPTLHTATVNGTSMVLTYNEPLYTTSTPATTDFAVSVNGSPVTVSSVSVSGDAVTLTLATPTIATNTITIGYTPGTNPIRSDFPAASLSGQSVTNENPLTLTYVAGSNGTLSGTTSQTVSYGSSGTAVTAVPNTGYAFANWSDSSTANPRTDTNVTSNVTVTANFTGIAPTISSVSITSSNANHAYAKDGDTISLSFDSNYVLTGSTVTISGHSVTAVCTGSMTSSCTATLTVTPSIPAADGTVTFSITGTANSATSAAVTSTSDSSSVSVDRVAPTGTTVLVASPTTNTTPTITGVCTNGDTLSVTVDVQTLTPTCTSNAYSVAPTALIPGSYTVGVVETDPAGNAESQVTAPLVITSPVVAPTYSVAGTNSGGGYLYVCTDPKASNYDTYPATGNTGCIYSSVAGTVSTSMVSPAVPMTPALSNTFGSGSCPASLTITGNMKVGSRGSQVTILQKQINRILAASYSQAAGPTDGIFGSLTKTGVMRLQTVLNTVVKPNPILRIDGIVGPFTKAAINDSCGGM